MSETEFWLYCNDEFSASASGPGAWEEIQRYAAQYAQDGPVRIEEVIRRPVGSALPADRLHAAIMNLPCNPGLSMVNATEAQILTYKLGHRDARHAAAELAATATQRTVRTEPVAVDLSAEMHAQLYVLHPDGSLSPAHMSGVPPVEAHSKSEYKRRVAQGDPNVAPPCGVRGNDVR